VELQQNYAVFKKLDTEIIAIAQEESDPSTMERVNRFVKNEFPVVADPDKVTDPLIKRYGVYIVDKKGKMRYGFEGVKTARPRIDMLVGTIAKMQNLPAPKIELSETGKVRIEKPAGGDNVKALAVRWMWSHDRVRPGDEFKLAFCPVIAPGFHVYGAREKEMTPFRVEFQFPEGIALEGAVTYPKAHVIDDPVLKMKLAVYEQDIPVSTLNLKASDTLKPGELTVTAVITYQACNSEVCLPPSTMKKTFKLTVTSKDKKRQQVYGWERW
jgi:hypothetical protein